MSSEAASSSSATAATAPVSADAALTPGTSRLSSARLYWRLAFFLLFLGALFIPGNYMDPGYRLPKFNRFMALALYALSVDLIWGYTGLLSLGQGLYFGIGGYMVGYSLILQKAALDAGLPRYEFGPTMALPPFMFQNRLTEVPSFIAPLINIWTAIGLAVLLPMAIAGVFGFIVFQRRIKGVYFSLITQALVLAVFYFVMQQMAYTGAEGGLYNLAQLEIFDIQYQGLIEAGMSRPDAAAAWAWSIYLLITITLVVFALGCFALVNSKFGKILTAIRDNEFRVMALGYNTAMYKTFVFALAGAMAGIAGALYVAANRTAGPSFFSIGESIEVVILVAVGGRGTLMGPILGALLVSEGKDYINEKFSAAWPIILGSLFIGLVLFLPEGLVGGVPRLFRFVRIWFYRRAGLPSRWNVVRIGLGLMYWGVLAALLAVIYLIAHTLTGARSEPFEGLFGSIFQVLLYGGGVTALVGLCLCAGAPSESRGRALAIAAITCLAVLLAGMYVASMAAPAEVGGLLRGHGFGEDGLMSVLPLSALAVAWYALFAWFLRAIAGYYRHGTLADSARTFVIIGGCWFLTGIVLSGLAAAGVANPVFTPVVFLIKTANLILAIIQPVWFLRLLYQTHECINRPLAA